MRSVTIKVWVGKELLSSDLVDEFSRTIGGDGVLTISASRRGAFAPFQVTADGLKVDPPLAGEETVEFEIAPPRVSVDILDADAKPFSASFRMSDDPAVNEAAMACPPTGVNDDASQIRRFKAKFPGSEPFMAFDFRGETPPLDAETADRLQRIIKNQMSTPMPSDGADLLSQLHAALGWQGGTVHDALAHVRELRERAEALAGLLRLLKEPSVKEAENAIHAHAFTSWNLSAFVKATGVSTATEAAVQKAKADELDSLLAIIGVRDVELAKRLIINERAARLEAVKEETVSLADLREALGVPAEYVQGNYTAKRCLRLVAAHTQTSKQAWLDKNLPAEKVVAPASTNTDPDSAARDLEERWRAATSPIRSDKSLPIATPEPPSTPDPDGGDILLELANEESDPKLREEILARRIFGIDKHKKPLQRRNGRGHHNDYRQELIDALAYARAGDVGKGFEFLLREMLLGRDPVAGVFAALGVADVVKAHERINELHVHEKGLAEIRRVAYDANPLAIADLLKRAEEDRQSIQAIRNSFAELDATPTIRNVEEPIGTQVAKLFDAICGAMRETDLSRAIQGAECNYHLADLYRVHAPWLGDTIDATVISLGGDPPEVVMVARVEPDVCQRIGKNPGLYASVKVVIGEGA